MKEYRTTPADFKCLICRKEWVGWKVDDAGAEYYAPHEQCPGCGSEPEWHEREFDLG